MLIRKVWVLATSVCRSHCCTWVNSHKTFKSSPSTTFIFADIIFDLSVKKRRWMSSRSLAECKCAVCYFVISLLYHTVINANIISAHYIISQHDTMCVCERECVLKESWEFVWRPPPLLPILPPVFILSPTAPSLSGTSCLLEGESTPTESPSVELQIPDRWKRVLNTSRLQTYF